MIYWPERQKMFVAGDEKACVFVAGDEKACVVYARGGVCLIYLLTLLAKLRFCLGCK